MYEWSIKNKRSLIQACQCIHKVLLSGTMHGVSDDSKIAQSAVTWVENAIKEMEFQGFQDEVAIQERALLGPGEAPKRRGRPRRVPPPKILFNNSHSGKVITRSHRVPVESGLGGKMGEIEKMLGRSSLTKSPTKKVSFIILKCIHFNKVLQKKHSSPIQKSPMKMVRIYLVSYMSVKLNNLKPTDAPLKPV